MQPPNAAPERVEARLVTVSFVTSGEDVLLLRHPQDSDRFAGQWNGIGGHVESGEGIRDAAIRELREEAGLDPAELVLRGVVHETGLLGRAHVLFVFRGRTQQRAVSSPEGLELRWQPISELSSVALVHDVAVLLCESRYDSVNDVVATCSSSTNAITFHFPSVKAFPSYPSSASPRGRYEGNTHHSQYSKSSSAGSVVASNSTEL